MSNRLAPLLGFAVLLLAACQLSSPPPTVSAPLIARFYLEAIADEAAVTMNLPQSGTSLRISPKPVFSEYDIAGAEVARVELGLCVLVKLTPAAARDLYRLSVPAQGRRLVLSLNDVSLGVHRIEHAMADGVVPVFLEVPDGQLHDIVKQLKNTSADLARLGQKNNR